MSVFQPCHWLVLNDGAHPTEDIYFNHVATWLASKGYRTGYVNTRESSPWRLWPWHAYAWRHANILVTRSLKDPWLKWLEQYRGWFGDVFYLLDDDLLAAARDQTVPEEYRIRMREIVCDVQPRIFALANEVIVCSEDLARTIRHHHARISVLPPSLISALPDHAHHQYARKEIGFHGTRAHLRDLGAIAPALKMVHDRYEESEFEIMLGDNTPDLLKELERVRYPAAMKWDDFLTYQRRRRLHIGLAPLWPSAFNRGKSWIKILDIAVMGAAGAFSARAPYTDVITDGKDGLLVEDDPIAWEASLMRLLKYPRDTEAMAKAAADTALSVGDPRVARDFWLQRTVR